MNLKAFEKIISFYKQNYTSIEKQEIYKWQAVKTFKDNWDIESENFYEMLNKSLSGTYNLMSAGNYYPRKMILWMAENDQEAVRVMFRNLFSLELDLPARIKSFQSDAEKIIEKYKEKKVKQHYQDHRAIMVYLSLRFPDKFYLYKYTMFSEFVKKVDYDYAPVGGRIENLYKYESLCNWIHNYILNDKELLELNEPRREKYYDPEYHLLVQDIIYSHYYLEKPEYLEPEKLVEKTEFDLKAVVKKAELKETKVDYIEQDIKKKKIGDLGEFFIFSQEREKVKKLHLPKDKKVEWISRDAGDGLGYDICSYDSQGNKMYIEVKTTTGQEDTSFYISANELLKSEQVGNQYYLYRVFEFDTKSVTGKISVRRGSLKDLCISPQTYKVEFN